MHIDFLLERFAQYGDNEAIVWHDQVFTYAWMLNQVRHWQQWIADRRPRPGTVVALEADFSPNSVALLLALIDNGAILIPLSSAAVTAREEFLAIGECELSISIDADDRVDTIAHPRRATHPLYQHLRDQEHPGLVLFSSGSTGKSKAAVHDFRPLLEKFHVPRRSLRSIAFLLYDHIGGINTLLYSLANGGCVITVADRKPETVLAAIDRHRVELLPTSPTFINLILLSEAYKRYDLSSLNIVSYGTEPMPQSTLQRFAELFPHLKLQQTYGLSEIGIMRSKSKSNDSLWVKIGGEGFETRIVNGILHVKARSAMLGYLNAPSPFTEDGWLNTGDAVEVDGEYLRILGRKSELINVGGEKVYPSEVESVIQEMDNVAEVVVFGEKNPIVGQIVCAKVRLHHDEDSRAFINRLKRYCGERIPRYKIPVKVTLVEEELHGARLKKTRYQPEKGSA